MQTENAVVATDTDALKMGGASIAMSARTDLVVATSQLRAADASVTQCSRGETHISVAGVSDVA